MNEELNKDILSRKIGLFKGKTASAFSLCSCYLQGSFGCEKDMELAFQYLKYAADLCHPIALNVIYKIYLGTEVFGIKQSKNIQLAEKYLRMLCFVDQVVNVQEIDGYKEEQVGQDMCEAYSRLGLLYMQEESLGKRWLGHMISLDLAENHRMPMSHYAMGWWFAFVEERNEANYLNGLKWLESCIRICLDTGKDKDVQASAVKLYNGMAEIINTQWRYNCDNQIAYL